MVSIYSRREPTAWVSFEVLEARTGSLVRGGGFAALPIVELWLHAIPRNNYCVHQFEFDFLKTSGKIPRNYHPD